MKQCRSCNAPTLTEIFSLGNSYLSEFRKDTKKPQQFPLNLVLCSTCFLVQLADMPPQDILYTENYGYKSGINQTMRKELQEIVEKAQKKMKRETIERVVDIGANDGTLLANYPKSIEKIAVEPIKKLAKDAEDSADIVINDFFTKESFQKRMGAKKADIVTIISCFYDMPNPNQFLEDVKSIVKETGIIIIQQNYLVEMLKLKAFDNIVHEHLEYYSLLSLQNLLKEHDLEVFDVELTPINGGSFRTYISFTGHQKISKRVEQLVDKEKKLHLDTLAPYTAFANSIAAIKKELLTFIKAEKKKGKSIAVYGASTRGNTLLQYFALDNTLIDYAVERNEEKWGTYISSVGIPIISEEEARKKHPDYLLVLPWFFKEEFLEREKAYLQSGGHFIFPLPTFEVI